MCESIGKTARVASLRSLFKSLPLLAFLGASSVSGEIIFAENGEVVIPKADLSVAEGKMVAKFKAGRWGMYLLSVEGAAGSSLRATVNGEGSLRKGEEVDALGTCYIKQAGPCVIEVAGDGASKVTAVRLTPVCEGTPVVQKAGEAIELDAKDSVVEGVMLRYEPNPRKLCLGYWGNPNDTPRWDFTVTTPGTYEVILTQGCGKGAGGSEAVLETAGASLAFTVMDTGAYQNWVEVPLGRVTFEEVGRQQLRVRILKKARGIMDIRRIVLKPVAE